MRNFFNKRPYLKNKDLIYLSLIGLLSFFLFFFKLGGTSLVAWDEAWYAEIARNILKNKDLFFLSWNGDYYLDHPPLGFWLIAASFKIFGISEFAARLPMALSGLGSLILIFLIGKKLFKDSLLSFCSALILATMPWFWLRARTANLDILLVFCLLLSLYYCLKSAEEKRFLPFLGLSLGLAFLSKTLVALTIVPVLIYVLLPVFGKMGKKDLKRLFLSFLIPVVPWYLVNLWRFGPYFLQRHFLETGLRMGGLSSGGVGFKLPELYFWYNLDLLHMGILLWYKIFLIAFVVGLVFLRDRQLRIVYLWVTIFLLLFSTSSKTGLWHLIPVYPAIALLIPVAFYKLGMFGFDLASLILKKTKFPQFFSKQVGHVLVLMVILVLVIFTGGRHVRGLGNDIVKESLPSQEEILSRELSKYSGLSYMDDDYLPIAVFYSGRNINLARYLPTIFEKSPRPFLYLTKEWVIEKNGIKKGDYEILFKSGDRILIRSKQ